MAGLKKYGRRWLDDPDGGDADGHDGAEMWRRCGDADGKEEFGESTSRG